MAYLLFLALLVSIGFVFQISTSQKSKQQFAGLSFAIGMGFLSLGFLCELVLGFHLNADAARLFYWSREMMALAWFGHGVILLSIAERKQARWLTYALIFATAVSFILVGGTRVTKAEDWFRPGTPIFAQIGDLLATNRPTRWGGWLLNGYGAISLIAEPIYLLVSKKKQGLLPSATLLLLGAVAYLAPILWPPGAATPSFYLVEVSIPLLLYLGYLALPPFTPARKTKRRSK